VTQKKKAWGGRFAEGEAPLMERFNASLPFDKRLYAEDIAGSRAHAKMLAKIGVLTKAEQEKIDKGLAQVLDEINSGKFEWKVSDEDIHMAVEARLTEIVGAVGGKLHTARSRNDQVALDLRLYCKNYIATLRSQLNTVQNALVTLADSQGFVVMPGYTHLQRAQPIYWAHHLLAYFEMLSRDSSRLADASARLDLSPLGSGALAGSTFELDREMVAKELGFAGVTRNSLDSVSDRDFVAEILFDLSLLMIHLSRLSEELILWSSQEFSFITLPQRFCTGSSMMPQKVNPDAPELIRGKSGRVVGSLMSLLTLLKGLPLTYNKDLQEDKEPLFDAFDTVSLCLEVLAEMLPDIKARPDAMKRATAEGFLLATDVAEYLVTKGVEFRNAHEIVGKLVQYCLSKQKVLEKLTLEEMRQYDSRFSDDIFGWLDCEIAANKRKSIGGTAKVRVEEEIKRARKLVS